MLNRVWHWLAAAGFLLSCLFGGTALAEVAYDPGHWNMPRGVTALSREIFSLHMLIFWVCVAIGVVVFGAMFYSVFAHRRSRHPKPADFHESTTVEIAWTIVPFVILVLMAIPAAGTLLKMEDSSKPDLSVKVTGYQWKWHYEYVDQGVGFFSTLHPDSNRARQLGASGGGWNATLSGTAQQLKDVPNYLLEVDNRLVLPVGKKVRFVITSNDVIHAWWVPDLAIKKDAVPGFVNEMSALPEQTGIYRGVCAELCGRDHGFMPVVVEVVSAEQFDRFLAARKAGQPTEIGHGPQTGTPVAAGAAAVAAAPAQAAPAPAPAAPAAGAKSGKAELVQAGEKVFNTQCAACHQANGQGLPPNFPSLVGSAVVTGPVAAHVTHTLNGKGLMPPFKHLSDQDIAAVLTYQRNSWGNNAGEVQPAQVAEQRK